MEQYTNEVANDDFSMLFLASCRETTSIRQHSISSSLGHTLCLLVDRLLIRAIMAASLDMNGVGIWNQYQGESFQNIPRTKRMEVTLLGRIGHTRITNTRSYSTTTCSPILPRISTFKSLSRVSANMSTTGQKR